MKSQHLQASRSENQNSYRDMKEKECEREIRNKKEIQKFWGIQCQATKIKINTTTNGCRFTLRYINTHDVTTWRPQR